MYFVTSGGYKTSSCQVFLKPFHGDIFLSLNSMQAGSIEKNSVCRRRDHLIDWLILIMILLRYVLGCGISADREPRIKAISHFLASSSYDIVLLQVVTYTGFPTS